MLTQRDTDKLYDTTPRHLAELFGQRTREAMQSDRHCAGFARLAASYAQIVLGQSQPEIVSGLRAVRGDCVIGSIRPASTCVVSAADYREHWKGGGK